MIDMNFILSSVNNMVFLLGVMNDAAFERNCDDCHRFDIMGGNRAYDGVDFGSK